MLTILAPSWDIIGTHSYLADQRWSQIIPISGTFQWAIQDSNLGPLPYQRSALTD